jgi:hypothetical protein
MIENCKPLKGPLDLTFEQEKQVERLNCLVAKLNKANFSCEPHHRVREAFAFIKGQGNEKKLSVEEICHINKLTGCEGVLRKPIECPWSEENVAIRGYHGAPGENLPDLLCEYAERYGSIASKFSHPLRNSCEAYLLFELLHPFKNGNGRTGRFISAWMMFKHGYGILAPFLEIMMGNENKIHAKLFESQITNYLAWHGKDFHVYFVRFFDGFLRELIEISFVNLSCVSSNPQC